jgi:hypothetical protein
MRLEVRYLIGRNRGGLVPESRRRPRAQIRA